MQYQVYTPMDLLYCNWNKIYLVILRTNKSLNRYKKWANDVCGFNRKLGVLNLFICTLKLQLIHLASMEFR